MEKSNKSQMSLSEAGQFDRKFVTFDLEGNVVKRQFTTGWSRICAARHIMRFSRKARIKAAKAARYVAPDTEILA